MQQFSITDEFKNKLISFIHQIPNEVIIVNNSLVERTMKHVQQHYADAVASLHGTTDTEMIYYHLNDAKDFDMFDEGVMYQLYGESVDKILCEAGSIAISKLFEQYSLTSYDPYTIVRYLFANTMDTVYNVFTKAFYRMIREYFVFWEYELS